MTVQILSQRWFHLGRFIAAAFQSGSLKNAYDSTAVYYENIFGENQEYYSALILDLLERRFNRSFQSALDLGAGTGILTRRLSAISDRVCGIDFSSGMLEQAGSSKRDQGGINYIAGDVLALPFPDKQFQLITALGVMSHILPQGFPRFVGEIDRVATESAVVVIAQTPLPWRLFFARRSAFQPTLLDKALAALYNLLQTTMGLDERRGVYTPEVVSNEFSKHHFSVEFHIVQNLSVMIACR